MLGLRFIKVQPTVFLMHYQGGKVVKEGLGLSFFYYAPTSSLVAVPMGSSDAPFIFEEVTADFQSVTIQGQITYRIADPKKIAGLLNFTLDAFGRGYVSDDLQKLPPRLVNAAKVLAQTELQGLGLKEATKASNAIVEAVGKKLAKSPAVEALGVEILGFSILAIKPTPETARALEAEAREQLLRHADEAIYARRNSAVEQERAIKENELNTEIAVENKKRQIREAQMDAERAVQAKRYELENESMQARIGLEEQNQALVALSVGNERLKAEAKAYGIGVAMKAFEGVDPKVLQAVASAGMKPEQLIAAAFQEIAGRADKIGALNITPDLLRELMETRDAQR